MAAAPLIVMGAGAAISAYGAIKDGQDKADAYTRQAYLKRLQADEMLQSAQREAGLTLQKGEDIKQAQISGFGRSGVDVSSGSPLAEMAKTTSMARSEADAIIHAGNYRAFTSTYEAADAELLGQNAMQKGYISAIGSTFNAVGDFSRAKGNL